MRKVKWGVLGVAKIAVEKVIPAMQRGEASDIAAIASRDLGKARAAADKLGIARAYGSYEELLADPEIEAVYNPLPNELHVPWTLRALAAGKHVLCEKPIALDADEARTLIEARDRSGKLVAEAFMVRYHPQWRRAKELAGTGAIGRRARDPDLLLLSAARSRQCAQHARRAAAALYDIGCYAILTARYIFGAEPTRVVATIDRDPNFRTDRLGERDPRIPRRAPFDLHASAPNCRRTSGSRSSGDAGRIEIMIPFNAPPDRPTKIADRHRRRSVRRRAAGRAIPGLRSVHAAGRRLLARDPRRDAARIPDRGRHRQHAGHRRAVPLGQSGSWETP